MSRRLTRLFLEKIVEKPLYMLYTLNLICYNLTNIVHDWITWFTVWFEL